MAQFSFSSSFGFGGLPHYEFASPINVQELVEETLFLELFRTPAFQRLAKIRFLGGIDYLFVRNPNGAAGNTRYTRLQHSLGVARLALKYAASVQLSANERRLIVAAALLHDIGHAPLSHSVEPVFQQVFGIDHHQASIDVICGNVSIGRAVAEVLQRHSVDADELIALISGRDARFDGFFSGPINFDTIEGILRSRSFGNAPSSFDPDIVVDAAANRTSDSHREIVDRFWNYKDQVYRHVINSSFGILADHICQSFMRQHLSSFDQNDYYSTEDAFFRKTPGLRALLVSPTFAFEAPKHLPAVLPYVERRFYVNASSDFDSRRDKARYLQTKAKTALEVPLRHDEWIGSLLESDLFGDDSNRASAHILE